MLQSELYLWSAKYERAEVERRETEEGEGEGDLEEGKPTCTYRDYSLKFRGRRPSQQASIYALDLPPSIAARLPQACCWINIFFYVHPRYNTSASQMRERTSHPNFCARDFLFDTERCVLIKLPIFHYISLERDFIWYKTSIFFLLLYFFLECKYLVICGVAFLLLLPSY